VLVNSGDGEVGATVADLPFIEDPSL